MKMTLKALIALSAVMTGFSFLAQAEEDGMGAVDYSDKTEAVATPTTGHPVGRPGSRVGRKAAQKYMGQNSDSKTSDVSERREPAALSNETHYLAIHVGTFVGDDTYKWGSEHESNVGKLNVGVTYRIGEWANAADLDFRADFSTFQLAEGGANKLSLLPVIIFPDASSHFPIYFGAGAGPGFYMKQISGQSAISLDYQLFLGARFFNVVDNMGFFVESGLKNHIHLLSNGQYNGSFVAVGALFAF